MKMKIIRIILSLFLFSTAGIAQTNSGAKVLDTLNVNNNVTAGTYFGGLFVGGEFQGDGSNLINISGVNISSDLLRGQVDNTSTAVAETSTILLNQGSRSYSTASGTLTTIGFSGVPNTSNPATELDLIVTNGPYTITIPASRELQSVNTTTTLVLPAGNHELAWTDVNGAYWLAETSTRVQVSFTSTATAAGTTTLTAISTVNQFFTGTTTQTVVLPVTSTLPLGQPFQITNNSTGTVTVNSSGGNLVVSLPAGAQSTETCILLTGTTAASWSVY